MSSELKVSSLGSEDSLVQNETRGPVVTAVTIWLLGFATGFVALRCVSRIGIVKRWSWDDSFMILAWVLAFGFSFTILWGVRNGLGRHEQYILPEKEPALRMSEYAFSVIYNPVLMATKTSILLFYLTLTENQPIFKWATISTIAVVNVAGLALTILNVFQCRPVQAVFERGSNPNASCTDMITIYLSSSPVNVITDLAILVLPFPVLTKMRLPRKQKIILIITFSFGLFVAAVDIVRIAYLQQAFTLRLNQFRGTRVVPDGDVSQGDDFSWYASLSFMWSAVEVDVGIICACVPSLKPLVARVLPGMLRDITNPQDQTQRNGSTGRGNTLPPSPTSPTTAVPVRAHIRRTPSEALLHETAEHYSDSRPMSRDAPSSGPHMNGNANSSEREMDFMEFLTTPDMRSPREIRRIDTVGTSRTSNTNGDSNHGHGSNITFYDFYNIESKKPMTQLTVRQSIAPLAVVTLLFFLWGFAYGLLDVLNSQFTTQYNVSDSQSVGLHAAYFGAYAVGPPSIGRAVFTRFGFKATFMVGLCIYGVGTLIFWPSAVLGSFPAFIICNFVVGFGISIIETGANPFVALCGPPQHMESRLQISQGLQAIGTVVSPLLAKRVFFKSVNGNGEGLINVQWAYLAIAFFDVILAVVFFYLPLPEASDEDFERVAARRSSVNNAHFFGKFKVVHVTLGLAVVGQFFYCGAQEGIAQVYQHYIEHSVANDPDLAFQYQTIGHAVFAFGRFVCAIAALYFQPRNVLLVLVVGMIVTSSLMMHTTGNGAVVAITLYQFAQSGAFSLLFAIPLRGLGALTKTGSVFITAAISGGAIFPVIMDPIIKSHGFHYSICVVVSTCVALIIFPIYLTAAPKARRQVDPIYEKKQAMAILPQVSDGVDVRRSWLGRRKRFSDPSASEHVEEKARRNGSTTS